LRQAYLWQEELLGDGLLAVQEAAGGAVQLVEAYRLGDVCVAACRQRGGSVFRRRLT